MQRGAQLSTYGLPSENTLRIGVQHLGDYLLRKRDLWTPIVSQGDYLNYIMLAYYRNPLNQIFFNEGLIIVSLKSFGEVQSWKSGVPIHELFERASFINKLLEKEEVQRHRIMEGN